VAALLEGAAQGRLVSAARMHADELDVDVGLVRRLLQAQFPAWSELPLEPVLPRGTDHAIFRLGDELVVRLPRIGWAVGQPELEQEWLPRLAPHLTLAVPRPVALGAPGEGYPHRWAVHTWVPGEPATAERIGDPVEAALDLARFVTALWRIDTADAPPAGRGEPLSTRDEQTRIWLGRLDGVVDTAAVTEVWEAALAAPVWDGSPLWVHGDLDSRNLLAVDGRLSGLVDFGCLGVGDPACDVSTAWKMFPGETRDAFRAELGVDDATWSRARGHVVSQSLGALAYYTLENNAVRVLECRRWLAEALAD
jgi:aminoglycoside phosphotransferase (APT) family kinase protein